jgi:nucleoid-associated protein YgaU
VPETDNDIFVITQLGDRLDQLAEQFYKDSSLWWYIAQANGLTSLRVESGTSLRIPGQIDFATSI